MQFIWKLLQVITIGQGRSVTYNGLFLTPDQMPFITDDDEGKLIIANGTQFVVSVWLDCSEQQ